MSSLSYIVLQDSCKKRIKLLLLSFITADSLWVLSNALLGSVWCKFNFDDTLLSKPEILVRLVGHFVWRLKPARRVFKV